LSIAKLSRERVLRAAIRLADEGGIESLTMRKLARKLGVEAMSLYNHVAGKSDLVEGMVDVVVAEIELPEDGEWDAAIRACAISAHDAFIRHPWAPSLVVSSTNPRIEGNPRLRYMEWLLRRLRKAGFSAELTYHAYHALDSHILGFTLWQLGHSAAAQGFAENADFRAEILGRLRAHDLGHLAEHAEQHFEGGVGDQSEFEFGLDLILDGLHRRFIRAR
jgi:AcrR family transcriptional regulator